eukprot:gene2708-biopygen4325
MCTTFAEATELCSLAKQHNLLLAVYQNRRWDGDFKTVSALIKSGSLGRVVEFESHFDRFRNSVKSGWKEDASLPGSGILYDLVVVGTDTSPAVLIPYPQPHDNAAGRAAWGSHLIDQALVLFGQPDALTAHLLNQRHLPATTVPDAFTVTLHYDHPAGPLTVILRASMLTKQPGARFTVHGTLGSYIKQGMDVQEGQLRAGMSPVSPGFGVEGSAGCRGVLDTLAVDLATLNQTLGVALHDKPSPGLEPLLEDQCLEMDQPAAAAAAGAAAIANTSNEVHTLPSVNVATIAAAVLAEKDAGVSSSSEGSKLQIMTEPGCWMEFYNNVAHILLGDCCKLAAAVGENSNAAAAGEAPVGVIEAAAVAAAAAGPGSGSSSSSNCDFPGKLNSELVVQPEQAADVIRLIELAIQSSNDGQTIRLDRQHSAKV